MKLPVLFGLAMVGVAAPLLMAASAPDTPVQSPAPAAAPFQCFGSEDIVNWTAPGNRLLNLRLRDGSVVEGAMRGPCPSFHTGDTIGFSARARKICRGADLTVLVEVGRVRHADGAPVAACGFSGFRTLTEAEVAALPGKSRP